MPHAEALPDPVDAGEGLARFFGGVVALGRIEADVAVAAILLQPLAEVTEENPAAAGEGLGATDHGVQLVELDPILIGISPRLDKGAADGDVAVAEQQKRLGRETVAPGPAGLLVVALDVA